MNYGIFGALFLVFCCRLCSMYQMTFRVILALNNIYLYCLMSYHRLLKSGNVYDKVAYFCFVVSLYIAVKISLGEPHNI